MGCWGMGITQSDEYCEIYERFMEEYDEGKPIADIKADVKRLVIGMVGDKDITSMLKLLPKDATYYFCNASIPRALPAADLKAKAAEFGLEGSVYASVADALAASKRDASESDFIFIGGSNFTVAEIL